MCIVGCGTTICCYDETAGHVKFVIVVANMVMAMYVKSDVRKEIPTYSPWFRIVKSQFMFVCVCAYIKLCLKSLRVFRSTNTLMSPSCKG